MASGHVLTLRKGNWKKKRRERICFVLSMCVLMRIIKLTELVIIEAKGSHGWTLRL